MEQALEGGDALHRVKRGRPAKAIEAPVAAPVVDDAAQAYALRVWDGQSPDVPLQERIVRVLNALKGQSLSINITLPHPDAERHLAKLL